MLRLERLRDGLPVTALRARGGLRPAPAGGAAVKPGSAKPAVLMRSDAGWLLALRGQIRMLANDSTRRCPLAASPMRGCG